MSSSGESRTLAAESGSVSGEFVYQPWVSINIQSCDNKNCIVSIPKNTPKLYQIWYFCLLIRSLETVSVFSQFMFIFPCNVDFLVFRPSPNRFLMVFMG